MIKKLVCVVLCLASLSFCAFASEVPQVSAQCVALIVADSGELIYGRNEHLRHGMASTTKIMTALLTLECATPDRVVVTTDKMVNVEGTSMGLKAGDKVTFHDLVYGMLLASGNDAANTAAIAIDGSTAKFAQRMNKKAAQLGMADTSFVTPSGLDNENHYSTAYDMALLGRFAIKNPSFAEVCSSQNAKLCYGNEPYTRWLSNHNRLLRCCDGAVGIKTGFTKKSGRCLVSAAERNSVMLICVTLNAPSDWNDHMRLFDYGFGLVEKKQLSADLSQSRLEVYGGTKKTAAVEAEPLNVSSLCGEEKLQTRVTMRQFEFAPIKKGQVVGSVECLLEGKVIAQTPLVSAEEIAATTVEKPIKPSVWQRIKEWINRIIGKVSGLFS